MEQTTRVAGKTIILSKKRGVVKGGGPNHSYFCNGMFQTLIGFLQGYQDANPEILVGTTW